MVPLPLTSSGRLALLLGVCALACGWWLGWVELAIFGVGSLLSVVMAVPFVVGRLRLDVRRAVSPQQVHVGEPAVAVLRVSNPTKVSLRGRRVVEHVGGQPHLVDVDGLLPGQSVERFVTLPTERRGRFLVGPTVTSRIDPLGMMRREVVQCDADELWVRPRVVPTAPLPIGFARDLEGPTMDTSPAGDVSFHTLRAYTAGDDPRHIHWLSSARANSLMVRHHVDNRRPNLTIVLDLDGSAYGGDCFETAVEVATSLAANSWLAEQPFALYTAGRCVNAMNEPRGLEDIFDTMTLVVPDEAAEHLSDICSAALEHEPHTSVLVVVTGSRSAGEILSGVDGVRRRVPTLVVRTWGDDAMEPANLPGATLLDVDSVDRFALVWAQAVRQCG